MNYRSITTIGVAILAVLAVAQLCSAQPSGAAPAAGANPAQGPIVTTLRAQWQGVRDKVVNICDIVPEDKLDYKATPDVRSFRELITHIAGEGYNFLRPLGSVPGVTPPTNAELSALKTKAELMKALRDSYDWQGKVIDSLTEASATEMVAGRGGTMAPKWNAIVSLLVDNMDHYGNLVTYVRINGLVPPATAARGRGGRGGARGGGPGGGGAAAPGAAPASAPARGQ